MSKPGGDLAVVWRVYPHLAKPEPFGHGDKLKLVSDCLNTFWAECDGLDVDFHAILDSCPPPFYELLDRAPPRVRLFTYSENHAGNSATFCLQVHIAACYPRQIPVLLLEDDYYWRPGGLTRLLSCVGRLGPRAFVTPYHHPDYQRYGFHRDSIERFETGWNRALSTTCTFAGMPEAFESASLVFRKHQEYRDFGMWLKLTLPALQERKISFAKLVWMLYRNAYSLRRMLRMCALALRSLLSKDSGFALYFPDESLATHMDANHLGLGTKWGFD